MRNIWMKLWQLFFSIINTGIFFGTIVCSSTLNICIFYLLTIEHQQNIILYYIVFTEYSVIYLITPAYMYVFPFNFVVFFWRILWSSAAPSTTPPQVATNQRTDRSGHVLGRSQIQTGDNWLSVRCANTEPLLLLCECLRCVSMHICTV